MRTPPTPARLIGAAMLVIAAPTALSAQDGAADDRIIVEGQIPTTLDGLPRGPEVSGIVTARKGNRIQVTTSNGANTEVLLTEGSVIRSSGGLLGLSRDRLTSAQLLNGLPVEIETVQFSGGLIASKIDLKSRDLRTASMIRGGTAQGFAEQTAATEALRGRVGDIDKYNVKGTTNVNFATGKWNLTEQAKAELCAAAQQAEASENALLLVVGYTDAVGDEDYNQELSERRASRVVNHLQQACGWKPYRMLTPTGMAESDPLADNTTEAGKAQNRRVAVNILVSKAVDQM